MPEEEQASGHLERSPIHLLHRAGQCAVDIFQSEMEAGDLTPRQFAVLAAVAQHEGLSQTQLVDRTGIDRSTLADIVRRMLRKGLLQRRRTKEDARAYAVKLTEQGWRVLRSTEPKARPTEQGWRVLRSTEPKARRVDERILEALPAQQRDRFLDDLSTIVQALGKMQSEEPKAD